ncbi:MAG: 4-demethylwyosine synthase TYW1 [Candidatus Woesearchaeota archaeon]
MNYKGILAKQHYAFSGNHSAVKLCTWTKKALRGQGHCYKQQFYGIASHRCVQMSPSIGYCHNRCVFCWRPIEYTEGTRIQKNILDKPRNIIKNSLLMQKKLLSGYGGYERADKKKLKEAAQPKHFAISLVGEPTIYPKLNELITELHKQGFTTFLVTNGMMPSKLAKIVQPTQLYVSVDAPNRELFKKIDQPMLKDGWERLMKSLTILKNLRNKTRTTLRFTMIKGLNMVHPKQWAEIISKAEPMFVEVKAYMHVGFSRFRLKMENMPLHSEVKNFAEEICKHCNYRITDEKKESRVVLLTSVNDKKHP